MSRKRTRSGAGRPMSGALHHSNGIFGVVVEVVVGGEEGEGEWMWRKEREKEVTLDAENAIPEKAYLSQIMVVPSFKRDSIVDAISQRLAEKRRWMACSSSSEVDLRYESIIWPIVVV
jgi:hypothetical protein